MSFIQRKKLLAADNTRLKTNVIKRTKQPTRLAIKPPEFPRLSNPDLQDTLVEEFEPIFNDFYYFPDMFAYLTTYLTAAVTSESFGNERGYVQGSLYLNPNEPDADFWKRVEQHRNDLGSKGFQHKVNITNKQIVLHFVPTEIPIEFMIGTEYVKSAATVERTLKQIFPNFVMPKTYTLAENDFLAEMQLPAGGYSSGWHDLPYFKNLKFPDPPKANSYKPEEFSLAEDEVGQHIYDHLFAEVDLSHLFVSSRALPAGETRGNIAGLTGARVSGRLFVHGQIRLPMEFGLWALHATQIGEFVPKIFFDLAQHHLRYQILQDTKQPDNRAMPLEKAQQIVEETKKDVGFFPKPRTNAEGFAINSDANIYWIPQAENPAAYSNILRSSYNVETGEVKDTSKIAEIHNIPLLTDWFSDAFSYTNDTGTLTAISLSGMIPLDKVTIANYLKRPIEHLFGNDNNADRNFVQFAQLGQKWADELDLVSRYENAAQRSLVTCWQIVSRNYAGQSVSLALNPARRKEAKVDESEFNEATDLYARTLVEICRGISENLEKIKENALSTRMAMRFWFTLIGVYSQNGAEYNEAYQQGLEKNRTTTAVEVPDKFNLPNLKGLTRTGLMPHQALDATHTAKHPELVTLDTAPGGGKTIIGLIRAMQLKAANKGKLIMLICPGILVKENVNAINSFSDGQINAVAINAHTIEKMVKHLGYSRQDFIKYVKTAPPNTIFVVGMEFLTLKRDIFDPNKARIPYVKYGPLYIEQVPNTLLIRQLEPDIVIVDESQRAKNESAQLTGAVKQILAGASYKTIQSGTLVPNVTSDLPSQFGLLNPMMIGNKEKFEQRYGIADDRGRFIALKDEAGSEIRKDISPYMSWLQHRRPDWGFMLPKIFTQFWDTVQLTPKQQKWNNDLVSQAIEEIRRDPKIQKLLSDNGPGAEEALEAALQVHLAKIEIFVNAPDERPTDRAGTPLPYFADTEGLTKEDLISPKIPWLQRIIYHHFNGGQFIGPDGKPGTVLENGREVPIIFKKQDAKIIIFAYNKAVTNHIARHLKTPYGVLVYQAGDEEAIIKFRNDDRYKILVASENSLREGLNLQVASRVIRLQTLWSPGNQEQAISRVLRPDVTNKYNRPEINVDWFICNGTIEATKTARLISKIVANMRTTEAHDRDFMQFMTNSNIERLELIKMNLQNILSINTKMDLLRYFDAYEKINDWEVGQFTVKQNQLMQRIANRKGITVETLKNNPDLLKREAMSLVESTTQLPGSRTIFTPLPNGGMPVDHRGLDLKPLAVLKNEGAEEEDEADTSAEDAVTIGSGDLVQTEFGFGHIVGTPRQRSVKVSVPGFNDGAAITLSKQVVFKPTNPVAIAKLKKEMKAAGSKGITFIHSGDTGGLATAPKVVRQPKSIEAPTTPVVPTSKPSITLDKPVGKPPKLIPEVPDEKNIRVEALTGVFDGYPTIYVFEEDHDVDAIRHFTPGVQWRMIPQFFYRRILTYRAAQKLVATLTDGSAGITLPKSSADSLLEMAKKLNANGSGKLIQTQAMQLPANTFLRKLWSEPKLPTTLRAYPMVIDGELFLVGMARVQPDQMKRLQRIAIPGVDPLKRHSPMMIYIAPNLRNAIDALHKLRTNANLTTKGINDGVKFFSTMAKRFVRK